MCLRFFHIPYIGPIPLQIIEQKLVQRCETHIEGQSCRASYTGRYTEVCQKNSQASVDFILLISLKMTELPENAVSSPSASSIWQEIPERRRSCPPGTRNKSSGAPSLVSHSVHWRQTQPLLRSNRAGVRWLSHRLWTRREEIPVQSKVGGIAAKTSLDQLFVQYKCTVMDEINGHYLQLPLFSLQGFPLFETHQIGRATTGEPTLLE